MSSAVLFNFTIYSVFVGRC